MPRYFFDIYDGGSARDDEGTDLTGWLWTGLIERISQD